MTKATQEYVAPQGARCERCGASVAGQEAQRRMEIHEEVWCGEVTDHIIQNYYTCLACLSQQAAKQQAAAEQQAQRDDFARRLERLAYERGTILIRGEWPPSSGDDDEQKARHGSITGSSYATYHRPEGSDYCVRLRMRGSYDTHPMADNVHYRIPCSDALWAGIRACHDESDSVPSEEAFVALADLEASLATPTQAECEAALARLGDGRSPQYADWYRVPEWHAANRRAGRPQPHPPATPPPTPTPAEIEAEAAKWDVVRGLLGLAPRR